ncbi:MAG: HRDC domain-containing protein, partial [Thiotrichaceae bacterium]|nr:HRDC domain-containing protein [Thiotrichaceae bacterium]
IDASAAFSHGQVYVALSRCKTFEGMLLSSPISQSAVKTDSTISQFVHHANQNIPTAEQLNTAKVSYQQKLMTDCFDFQTIRFNFNFLTTLLRDYQHLVQLSDAIRNDIENIEVQVQHDVFKVGEKFKNQLAAIIEKSCLSEAKELSAGKLPEDDAYLQERIAKASAYFDEKLQQKLSPWAFSLCFDTDNKELRKRINQSIDFLQLSLTIKLASLDSCRECFSVTAYLQALAKAEIDFKAKMTRKKQSIDYSSLDIEHPELFLQLKNWRSEQAEKEDVALFQVLHQKVIIQMVIVLPDSLGALKKIKGVGKRTVEKYGEQLITIVSDFCQKNNIEANKSLPEVLTEPDNTTSPDKMHSSDTKQVSYELYKAGKSIAEIAQQRG